MATYRWCGIILLLLGVTTSMVAQKESGQWKPIVDKLKNRFARTGAWRRLISLHTEWKYPYCSRRGRQCQSARRSHKRSAKTRRVTLLDSIVVLPDQKLGAMRYGIVAASVANIRSEPGNARELGTQYLMGTVVHLLKKSGSWYRVQGPDKYLGWLEGRTIEITDEQGIERWNLPRKRS